MTYQFDKAGKRKLLELIKKYQNNVESLKDLHAKHRSSVRATQQKIHACFNANQNFLLFLKECHVKIVKPNYVFSDLEYENIRRKFSEKEQELKMSGQSSVTELTSENGETMKADNPLQDVLDCFKKTELPASTILLVYSRKSPTRSESSSTAHHSIAQNSRYKKK